MILCITQRLMKVGSQFPVTHIFSPKFSCKLLFHFSLFHIIRCVSAIKSYAPFVTAFSIFLFVQYSRMYYIWLSSKLQLLKNSKWLIWIAFIVLIGIIVYTV